MKRRNILKGMGLGLATLPIVTENVAAQTKKTTVKIKFYAPSWGNNLLFDEFCKRVKAAGYDGIEMPLGFDANEKKYHLDLLAKHGLEFFGQYYQSFEKDSEENVKNYEKHIRNLASGKPVCINTQTGKDYFSFEQNKKIIDKAAQLSKELGVKIVHETHRGKALFAAHISAEYLKKIPDMRLTLDISHWCNVHESLLGDLPDEVNLALSRADHIHTRVGHQEGPQVNDPRAPEWAEALETHLKWWDKVVAAHEKTGQPLTMTTEFGPEGYLPTLPYTRMPVANQWDINVHMLNLLKKRYL